MPLWNELEGQSLDGLPLISLLRSEGRTAWFSTTDSEGRPAFVSVFEALNDEAAIEERLKSAAHVPHRNLLALRATAMARLTTEGETESLVYGVYEPYDQTLAEVLRERTLAPEEAREVAESLLSALEAIEAAGLRHGHVEAAGVLAVGDAIKLRSDCLNSQSATLTGDPDSAALAALIYQTLTGRRLNSERDAIQLPAPFATFVRAGLGSAGSLAAMHRILYGTAPAAAAPAMAAPASAVPTPAAPASTPTSGASAAAPSAAEKAAPDLPPGPRAGSVASPASAEVFATPPAPARTPAPPPRGARPKAASAAPRRRVPGISIAAVVLMLVVLVVLWRTFRHPAASTQITGQATPAVSANDQPQQQASAAPVNTAALPAKQAAATMGAGTPPREEPRPAPRNAVPPPAPASMEGTATGGRTAWHVIVYTYEFQSAAQRKAEELAGQYPQLEPQVFTPSGHAPYFVALGGAMDRDAAIARRDQARSAGLPRDTYAQNYRK